MIQLSRFEIHSKHDAVHGYNSIIPCRISPSGTLQALTGHALVMSPLDLDLGFSPKGNMLYVTMSISDEGRYGKDHVSQYRIGPTGLLAATPHGQLPTQESPINITVDAAAHAAYVVNSGGNSISQFHIAADGTLSEIDSPVFTDVSPEKLVAAPSGRFAYVVNNHGGSEFFSHSTISCYKISPTGTLMPLPSQPVGG